MVLQFILKTFAGINLLIGLLLRKRKSLADKNIRTILVKRTDRIGDAIVTLPLLLELSKHFKVTVLTSQYNDELLSKFLPTKIFTDKPLDFLSGITDIARNCFSFLGKPDNTDFKYDLFLDLNGLRELGVLLQVKRAGLCRYYASFNLGLWNTLLDFADLKYPVLFSREHLLDSCRRLVKGALGVALEVTDYVELADKAVKPEGFSADKFILVNIAGITIRRGPALELYARILNELPFEGKIVVIDELAQPHMGEFKKHIKKNNCIFIERDLSVWELAFLALSSVLYIGSDSGISNLLQIPTNAVLFYANGIPWVWRPYSKEPYVRKEAEGITIEETVTSRHLHKKIIYSDKWCRPCFDIGCSSQSCVSALTSAQEIIIREIAEMLS
ncbi:MAG: hypothetical protein PHQ96_01225 [Candidatus Omnitrophica bacterium]|nr:hypothetical protein [Candidatus Omnitrophota bacterium]